MGRLSLPMPFPFRVNTAESRLIERAAKGDRSAFDALMEMHHGPLRAFVANRVAVTGAIDDVVQETLLAAWVALPRYKPNAAFRTWLFRIALNKSADVGRQSMRRGLREMPMPDYPIASSRDHVLEAEARILAESLLSEIEPEDRLVFELYYQDGLTLVEIAEVVERNLNTVKSRFYRLHSQMADRLSDNAANLRERPTSTQTKSIRRKKTDTIAK